MQAFDKDQLIDFVASHGFGEPTSEGITLGKELMEEGDDYATAAHEIVCRELTTDFEYPAHVTDDLNNGFFMTDIDDGYQRCKKLSDTVYLFRCDVDGEVHEEQIDVTKINHEEAICGYYDSVAELVEEMGQTTANMIIAECHFENNCPMAAID